ncbi:MFS transporter [Psychrosphaera aestuarii]|uniref:MFS transporter n=1 Tax=Psychrosphaera aestuarii TaxID=1266052 RepID=UPI001B33E5A1|nr:MFS transporter [Psychrosphaera aestuarii]
MFVNMHKNVWLLMLSQALMGSIGPVVVFVGGFVGLKLAPTPVLATLPIACMIVGIAFYMLPAVKLLSTIGRKKGFIIAATWGGVNCLITSYAIYLQHFWLFCFAIFNFGFMIANSQQFRFAAMESVNDEHASEAISVMLIAGLIAAYIGPEIAYIGKDIFSTEFTGSFAIMALLYIPAIFLLSKYVDVHKSIVKVSGEPRSLNEIIKQPIFLVAIISATVAFSVMSFIMTATPISMHVHHGFDMADTKWVIQSHIIAMYLPSFFTGALVKRFGQKNMIISGVLIFFLCLMIGFLGKEYVHYWASLVLLGIGWNFMFISATSLLPLSYEPEERFKVQGFNDLIMFSCQAIASLSAGWVIKSYGWNSLLTMCVPLLLLTMWVVYVWHKNKNNKNNV